MKKALKKVLPFAVAGVMACSLAFAACGGNEDEKKDTSTPKDEALLAAFSEAPEYASFELISNQTNKVGSETYSQTHEATGKANIIDGDADITLVASGTGMTEQTSKMYLREFCVFEDKGNVDGSLEYIDYIGLDLDEIMGGMTGFAADGDTVVPPYGGTDMNMATGAIYSLALPAVNYVLVNIASVAETLEADGDVYTIDLIATAQKVISDVGTVINSVNGTTTVSDLLGKNEIKKYISKFTDEVPAATLKSIVDTTISSIVAEPELAEVATYINALTNITAGSSSYDYIVSLICSDEVKNLVNAAAGETVLEKTIGEFTVNELLALSESGMTINDIKLAFNGVAGTIFNDGNLVFSAGDADVVVSEIKMTYKLSGTTLEEQNLSVKATAVTTESGNTVNVTIDETAKIVYAQSAFTLENVDGKTVNYTEYTYTDSSDAFIIGTDESIETVTVNLLTQDGKYVGYSLVNQDGVAYENETFVAANGDVYYVEVFEDVDELFIGLKVDIDGGANGVIFQGNAQVKTSTLAEFVTNRV